MEVVGVDRIEEAFRTLAGGVDRQIGATERSAGEPAPGGQGVAAGAGVELAGPALARHRGRSDLDHRARLQPVLGRHVTGHDVQAADAGRVGRDAEELIDAVVHRHAVLDVEEAVVDAADVDQAVVLAGPPGQRRQHLLQAAARQPRRRAAQRLARDGESEATDGCSAAPWTTSVRPPVA